MPQSAAAGRVTGKRTGSLQNVLDRLNAALGRRIPEKRLFLRSDTETRFILLSPVAQVTGAAGSLMVVFWAIAATAILLMDSVGTGSLREQAQREQFLYEARLNSLAAERDLRADEAAKAQERFYIALDKISEMQSALLASEDRRKEMEAGVEVVQATLRRTIRERDDARDELSELITAMAEDEVNGRSAGEQARDMEATLAFLVAALERTADERDGIAVMAMQTRQEADHLALENRLMQDRNNVIFSRLEEAVTVSMEPLERMFRAAGLSPDQLLRDVRQGTERLTPIAISSSGSLVPDEDADRANAILTSFDRINLYRVAAAKAPFAQPVTANVRFTSGFGNRRDPITGRSRMHSGVDFAGPRGTAILATADGVVKKAGWQGGYGNTVVIQHAFGIETLYAHLSQISVKEGQRVSRGDRIGGMGTTGRSTGVHLHYEVHLGGSPVNPMTYIRAASNVF